MGYFFLNTLPQSKQWYRLVLLLFKPPVTTIEVPPVITAAAIFAPDFFFLTLVVVLYLVLVFAIVSGCKGFKFGVILVFEVVLLLVDLTFTCSPIS